MRILTTSVGPLLASNATLIANSQSGTAGANLTLNLPANLDTPRRLLLTCSNNETGHNFNVAGLNWINVAVTEVMAGANSSTTTSLYDYWSITSIQSVSNTANTVSFGTSGVASSIPLHIDPWAFPQISLQVDVTGTANVTVQQTLDELNINPLFPVSNTNGGFKVANWLNHPDPNLVNIVTPVQGNYAYPPTWVRLYLNSSTANTGYATIRVLQSFGPAGGR